MAFGVLFVFFLRYFNESTENMFGVLEGWKVGFIFI